MKITEDIREYVREQGMQEKSQEFKAKGAELYVETT
jgi:hypothetical protein